MKVFLCYDGFPFLRVWMRFLPVQFALKAANSLMGFFDGDSSELERSLRG